MTASGKVDRKRLPQIDVEAGQLESAVPPTTELETLLCDSWEECLGVAEVGIHQNFFDLGGSSLQAAMLTTQLSQTLGVEISTSLIFDLADIQQIAARLFQLYPQAVEAKLGRECARKHLKQQQESPANTDSHPLIATFPSPPEASESAPIFMVHPPGGIVVCYRALAGLLSSRRLYGIRSHGLHGREELPATIESMAAAYVEALRSVQPRGPYVLGGWSLGGVVAYEIAQQLIAIGESIDTLILLDTTIPEGASNLVPASEQVSVGLEYGIELTLEQLSELAPEEQLPFLWEHAKKLGVIEDDSPPEVVEKALEELQELFHHHIELCRQYKMSPLQASIALFRPQEVPFDLQVAEDRGWRSLARAVDVEFVPGHHHSMVQSPNVEKLAESINQLLS